MNEHELALLATDLCIETPQISESRAIQLIVAPCGLPNALSYEDFMLVKAQVEALRPDIQMAYDIRIKLP